MRNPNRKRKPKHHTKAKYHWCGVCTILKSKPNSSYNSQSRNSDGSYGKNHRYDRYGVVYIGKGE